MKHLQFITVEFVYMEHVGTTEVGPYKVKTKKILQISSVEELSVNQDIYFLSSTQVFFIRFLMKTYQPLKPTLGFELLQIVMQLFYIIFIVFA